MQLAAFYESLGGELIGSKTITIGGRCLVEVSYGWKNTDSIATRSSL